MVYLTDIHYDMIHLHLDITVQGGKDISYTIVYNALSAFLTRYCRYHIVVTD